MKVWARNVYAKQACCGPGPVSVWPLPLAGDSRNLFPFRERPGSPVGTRELMSVPPYVIVYRMSGDAVSMIRIWHSAQDRP